MIQQSIDQKKKTNQYNRKTLPYQSMTRTDSFVDLFSDNTLVVIVVTIIVIMSDADKNVVQGLLSHPVGPPKLDFVLGSYHGDSNHAGVAAAAAALSERRWRHGNRIIAKFRRLDSHRGNTILTGSGNGVGKLQVHTHIDVEISVVCLS